jgi:FixJ family two-component response regulator
MTHRVLIAIVDENRYVREGLKNLVQALGYSAAGFASASDYLLSGFVSETTCLITDLQIPDQTGGLEDLLIAHGFDIPIIFVTANRDESVRGRGFSTGALGVLCKPFDEQWLRGHIADTLKRRRDTSDAILGIVRDPFIRSAA